MSSSEQLVKEVSKVLSDIVEIKKNSCLDDYIGFVKSLLYFMGKTLVTSVCLRTGAIDKNTSIHIINHGFNSIFSNIPDNLENEFGKNDYLEEWQKKRVIEIVDKMATEDIMKFSIGNLYEAFITNRERKYLGQVYTPGHIVKYMVENTIEDKDIIENPYFKIIDPACGGGYFLSECYDRIKQIYQNNYKRIINANPEVKEEIEREGLHKFIIENNIWGTDIDDFAVFMTTVTLLLKDTSIFSIKPNIFNRDILLDSLFCDKITDFDLVIGNPPYIGHKKVDKNYRSLLEESYKEVYMDKSDICYCFFKKGYELLKKNGKMSFIVSRYLQESLSASDLRKYIASNFTIDTIIDFYGAKVFKGIGISPAIIKCIKNESQQNVAHIYKLKDNVNIRELKNGMYLDKHFEYFTVQQKRFQSDRWIIVNEGERNLFNKIDLSGEYLLNEICQCNQGIITGCDKAFIVDNETIEKEDLEREVIKPWIKNSDIDSYKNVEASRFIIYTDIISDITKYTKILEHISPYKDRLNRRRECIKGIRRWYELQWGRDLILFEVPKIIFPYKSNRNKFTIDYNNTLCSADVYIINIKDEYKDKISLEYLVAFLNSSLFEFYFKSVGKKLGENFFEYYPNKIMNLKIKIGNGKQEIEKKVKDLAKYIEKIGDCQDTKEEILNIIRKKRSNIDRYFYEIYGLNDEEIKIIQDKVVKDF